MLDLIKQLWLDLLSPVAQTLWDSIIFWKVIAAICLSVIVLSFLFRRQLLRTLSGSKIATHDKRVFTEANELLKEQALKEIIDSVEQSAAFSNQQLSSLLRLQEFHDRIENAYLLKDIATKANSYKESLRNLLNFTGQHFFTVRGIVDYFTLYPEKKSEDRVFYEVKRKELAGLSEVLWRHYVAYRKTVQNVLII